jgi:hypothetical protein
MGKSLHPEYGIKISHHIGQLRNNFFDPKFITSMSIADPKSGISGMEKSRSGIRDANIQLRDPGKTSRIGNTVKQDRYGSGSAWI